MTAIFLSGCAHPIKITPAESKIYNSTGTSSKNLANVAYHIPPDLLSLEVTTSVGGGDYIRYFPYQDIEMGYKQALENVFINVVKITSPLEFSQARAQGIDYIIQPQIVTNAWDTKFLTWPPTNFTVDLTSTVQDATGKIVANPRVLGVGVANDGVLSNPGLAGQRAMEDALLKTQSALIGLGLAPQAQLAPVKKTDTSTAKRLSELQDLKSRGLLTQSEYEKKRQEIIESL